MLFNLYGNQVEKISLSLIETNLAKFACTKEECMLSFETYQLNAGQTCYDDGNGWTHEVVYVGY